MLIINTNTADEEEVWWRDSSNQKNAGDFQYELGFALTSHKVQASQSTRSFFGVGLTFAPIPVRMLRRHLAHVDDNQCAKIVS